MEDVVLLSLQVLAVMAALLSLLFLAREAVRRALAPASSAPSSPAPRIMTMAYRIRTGDDLPTYVRLRERVQSR